MPYFHILKGVTDMAKMIVDNAKVMSKGQITLPKEIREQLGIGTGDRVARKHEKQADAVL